MLKIQTERELIRKGEENINYSSVEMIDTFFPTIYKKRSELFSSECVKNESFM